MKKTPFARLVAAFTLTAALLAVAPAQARSPWPRPTHQWSGRINAAGVEALSPVQKAQRNHRTFLFGAIGTARDWQLVSTPRVGVDFPRQAVVYLVLREHTNSLHVKGYEPPSDGKGVGTLHVSWIGIEPAFREYPAALRVVDRADTRSVRILLDGTLLGTVAIN